MNQLINKIVFNKQLLSIKINQINKIYKSMGNSIKRQCNTSFYLPPEQLYQNENYIEALKYEKNLLELSGLQVGQQIKIQDVEVNKEKEIIMHSFNVKKDENKKNIVLVHGYMSCGASYYKMLTKLSQEFNIYAIDIPGMGLSSRPKFNYSKDNLQENLDFFTDSLDKFTQYQNLDKFTLVGHSFGGYISAQYALNNPQKIENLFLVSPLGVTARDEQERQKIAQEQMQGGFMRTQLLKYFKNGFKNGETLQNMSNKLLVPTDYILNKWTNYWFPKEDDKLGKENMLGYIKNILKLPTSSDKALNNMFHVERLTAKVPLETALVYSPINTYLFYGSKDWMCKIGAERLQMKNAKKQIDIIQDAGHNIQLDQPMELANIIIKNSQKK